MPGPSQISYPFFFLPWGFFGSVFSVHPGTAFFLGLLNNCNTGALMCVLFYFLNKV